MPPVRLCSLNVLNEERNSKICSLGSSVSVSYAMSDKVDLINAAHASARALDYEILVRLVS